MLEDDDEDSSRSNIGSQAALAIQWRMRNFILIKRALFDSRLCYRGLN